MVQWFVVIDTIDETQGLIQQRSHLSSEILYVHYAVTTGHNVNKHVSSNCFKI